MGIVTVKNNSLENDILLVVKRELFEFMKFACDEYNNRGDETIIGYVDKDGYVDLASIALKKSLQIKASEFTHDTLEHYEKEGYVVYMIVHEKNGVDVIYSIVDAIAKNLMFIKTEFAADRTYDTEQRNELLFVALNTIGNRRYGNSSVEITEFVEMNYCDEYSYNDFYKIIDNTVLVSTDCSFDKEGWVNGGETNYIYIFDKNDGSFEKYIRPNENTDIKYYNKNLKSGDKIVKSNYQMCRLYSSSLYSDDALNSKYLIDGMINIGGKLFDTINVSFVSYDREYYGMDGCYLDQIGDNEYIQPDYGYYKGYYDVIVRDKNGYLYIDEEYEDEEEYDEDE